VKVLLLRKPVDPLMVVDAILAILRGGSLEAGQQ
jgi:hypothetical protein